MSPAAGSTSPIMCFSRVLLPQPLAPMMTKMSPDGTWKLTSRCTTKPLKAMVRPSTVILGSAISDAQNIGHDGEDRVDNDDEHDRGDHGRSRRHPDRLRAPARLHAAKRPGISHEHAEDRALAEADPEIDHPDAALGLDDVSGT